MCERFNDDRGVAMAFLYGKFVHGQEPHVGQIDRPQLLLHVPLVDGLDSLAIDPEELRHVFVRRNVAQPGDGFGETHGVSNPRLEPT